MARSLAGHVGLVTGGARRIGRSIAQALAAAGAGVVVNYAHSKIEAEQLVREIQTSGGHAMAWQADVSKGAEVRAMFQAVEQEFGRLDILVNNAGIFFPARFEELTEEQWDRILDTNLKAQYLCAQAAAPLMKRQGRGQIVNISSIGAFQPRSQYVHYCVSKAGVVMLTRCLARALGPEIAVNSVAPGKIEFPGEPLDEGYIRRAPLAKVGSGEDIADAVLFLAQSEFITGQVILVDGGRLLT